MVKSRRRRSRKRRGGFLKPSDAKKCDKAGVAWADCAAHIAKAKVEAVKAAAATPKAVTTVKQAAALKKIAPQLSHLHKKSTAGVGLLKKGVEDVETRAKMAEMRVRSDSSGGKKRRRKSRKLKKRRKSRKTKRRRKNKSKRKRKSRKSKRRKRRKSRKSRSRRRRR
tara:strand:+ start:238 stop:738 length:501 start_codon:yes stop_codon:yes gene_type:complete